MLYLDYNEKQIHGTKNFPVAFYHVDSSHPRYEMVFTGLGFQIGRAHV